jgi:hypothetical protein
MKYVIISGVVILAVFLFILIQIPKGIEPLTELYLENHTTLPAYLFLNHSYNFSFTVHNLEYTDMKYEYIIEAVNESGDTLFEIDRENISLADNESKTIKENFSFSKPFERAEINVLLNKITSGNDINSKRKFWWKDENYPNSVDIHFWVEEITGPKITITKTNQT